MAFHWVELLGLGSSTGLVVAQSSSVVRLVITLDSSTHGRGFESTLRTSFLFFFLSFFFVVVVVVGHFICICHPKITAGV